ncbi:hypothetical protein JFPO14_contig00019-0087 [Edwardsiella piscicida]|nr:hypothetical protein JFPO13_contig00005-0003 [Edwardsiella piscicida]GBK59431.1 hypothetical protein JFPO14_contig00019-0087 [Edwardsiella piscicida]
MAAPSLAPQARRGDSFFATLCATLSPGGPSHGRVQSAENGEINMKKMGTLLLLGGLSLGVSLLGVLLFLAVIYLDKARFFALLHQL